MTRKIKMLSVGLLLCCGLTSFTSCNGTAISDLAPGEGTQSMSSSETMSTDGAAPTSEEHFQESSTVKIATASIEELSAYSEGYFVYLESTNQKWGYLDIRGNVAIQPVYEHAAPFTGGRAAVKQDGLYGYIDSTGKTITPLAYEDAGDFSEGYAPFRQDGLWGYLDSTGAVVLQPAFAGISNVVDGVGCLYTSPLKMSVGADISVRRIPSNDLLFDLESSAIVAFSDGIFLIRDNMTVSGGDLGYYDAQGTLLDSKIRTTAGGGFGYPFHDGVAPMLYDYDLFGDYFVQKTCEKLIGTNMEPIYVLQIIQNYPGSIRMSYATSDGWTAIPDMSAVEPAPQDEVERSVHWSADYPVYNLTSLSLAMAPTARTWEDAASPVPAEIPTTYINTSGELMPVKNYAKNCSVVFSEGLAFYESVSGQRGYIDTSGSLAIDLSAVADALGEDLLQVSEESATAGFAEFVNGYARIRTQQGFGLIDRAGTVILQPKHPPISDIVVDGDIVVAVLENGSVIDTTGTQLFETKILYQNTRDNSSGSFKYYGEYLRS